MCIRIAQRGGNSDTSKNRQPPAGSDRNPTGILRLGFIEQRTGDNAVTQHDQNKSSDKFTYGRNKSTIATLTPHSSFDLQNS